MWPPGECRKIRHKKGDNSSRYLARIGGSGYYSDKLRTDLPPTRGRYFAMDGDVCLHRILIFFRIPHNIDNAARVAPGYLFHVLGVLVRLVMGAGVHHEVENLGYSHGLRTSAPRLSSICDGAPQPGEVRVDLLHRHLYRRATGD